MIKYILLVFPLILYGGKIYNWQNDLPINAQFLVHLSVISACLIFLLKRTRLQNVFDWLIGICFSIYFCVLYHNTVEFQFYMESVQYSTENLRYIVNSINIIPFKGMIDVFRYSPTASFQIIGNIIMLTPFAFAMLYFKWAKTIKQAIWYSFLCTLGIELIQLLQTISGLTFNIIIGRSFDIDDIILNTLGATIGVGCYLLWKKIEYLFQEIRKRFSVTSKLENN